MKIAIIITTPNFAGLNIKENILELCDFSETGEEYAGYPVFVKDNTTLYTTDENCLLMENLQDKISADLFIMPTIHRSEANKKTISCHTQGNWDKAGEEFGGIQKNLSFAPAFYLKKAFLELVSVQEEMQIDYEPTLECTHHGPQIESPTLFIEIGSTETEWKDKNAGKAIAKVIIKLMEFDADNKDNNEEWRSAIGIGGPHYCNKFNKVMERTDIAVGHVCPKYMLEIVDKDMIKQAFDKTVPKPEFALFDWKGLGQFKEKMKRILEELDIPYERTEQILKDLK